MHHEGIEIATGAQSAAGWMTAAETAVFMNVSEPSVRRLVRRKAVRTCRVGRRLLIQTESVNMFMLGGGDDAGEGGSNWRA